MNRGEMESFQRVVALCQPNDSSQLGQVLTSIREVISKAKALSDGTAIELPPEVGDIINTTINQMNNFTSQYEEKAIAIAKSNKAMNDLIERTMRRAQTSGAEAQQRAANASKSMDEVQGGVKVG